MADRLEKTSGQQLTTDAQEGLGELRRQIEAHRRHDAHRSYLSQAVGIFWREDDRSLNKLEGLYKQATSEGSKQSSGQAGTSSSDRTKEIACAIEADRQAVARHDTYSHYATGALKSAALFMPGRTGFAATVITHALDQASARESVYLQLADGTLGAAKGGFMRGAFHLLGKTELGIAAKGIGLGVSSRAVDSIFTRQNYLDEAGNLNLTRAGSRLSETTLNRQAIISDIATLSVAHGLFGKLDGALGGAIQKSPLISNIATASTFGFSSGAAGEIIRQQNAGQTFDLGKVLKCGSVQGLLDAAAAIPGGFQARAMALHAEQRSKETAARARGDQSAIKVSSRLPVVADANTVSCTPERPASFVDESGRLVIPAARPSEAAPISATDRLTPARSDASTHPASRHGDLDLALRGADFLEAASKLSLLPGEHCEWFGQPVEGVTGPFENENDFNSRALIYTAEKVRVYQIAGLDTKLIFPEDYAKKLDEIHQLRKSEALLHEQYKQAPGDREAETRWLLALAKVGPHPMSSHPLPEDYVGLLERVPDRTLVKKIIAVDQSDPRRPYYEQLYGKGFEAAATASKEGVITFFKPRRGTFLGEAITHEWSHLVDFTLPELNCIFSFAAELERKGFYARHYALYNDAENLAVHLGEELLNPEPARFMDAARKAPIRSAVLMLAGVEPVLDMVPTAQRSRFHHELCNRVSWLRENIWPEARKVLLSRILFGSTSEQRKATELLMTFENGGRWVDSLRKTGSPDSLRTLDLSRVALTDDEAVHLGRLKDHPALTEIKLGFNDIGDKTAEALAQSTNLTSLNLSRTDITDKGIDSISKLHALRSLDLTGTKVTDAAVGQLADRLPHLCELRLPTMGSITDASAPQLARIKRLQTLRLGGKNVTDNTLEQLKGLRNLIELDLAMTAMTDIGILHLLEMRGVYKLALGQLTTDEGAKLIAERTDLHTLRLSGTKITDRGVEALGKLQYLAWLDLGNTQITGSGLSALKIEGLGRLSLSSTPVGDGPLASIKANHPKLQELELSSCSRLSDRGVSMLSGHTSLKKIDLSFNRSITSASADSLASMPSLEDINLSYTSFSDEGVKALAYTTNLRKLNLSGTKVTDACLPELKKLNWLEELNLSNCGLSYGAVADLRLALPYTRIISAR
jgi:Leucine-rich repeat (LRR) protein